MKIASFRVKWNASNWITEYNIILFVVLSTLHLIRVYLSDPLS